MWQPLDCWSARQTYARSHGLTRPACEAGEREGRKFRWCQAPATNFQSPLRGFVIQCRDRQVGSAERRSTGVHRKAGAVLDEVIEDLSGNQPYPLLDSVLPLRDLRLPSDRASGWPAHPARASNGREILGSRQPRHLHTGDGRSKGLARNAARA